MYNFMAAFVLCGLVVIIGEVVSGGATPVEMTTRLGGRRVVDWLNGEQLPRIC